MDEKKTIVRSSAKKDAKKDGKSATEFSEPQRIKGFAPVAEEGCRALILGSMPSVKSLERGQYYGHPQNRFWRVMFAALNEPFEDDYAAKLDLLRRRGVALWDVVGECERKGSGDSEIKNATVNDVAGLLARFPTIARVGVNGGIAAKLFARAFPDVPFVRLPSTSPANASRTLDFLIGEYSKFLR